MDKRLQEKVNLRDYFDHIISDLDTKLTQRMDSYDREFHEHILAVVRENQLALDASNKAIDKSETAAEKRFDAVNEFRRTLSDQTGTFIARREFEASTKSTNDKVSLLTDRMNTNNGKSNGLQEYGATLISIAALVVSAIAVIILAFK